MIPRAAQRAFRLALVFALSLAAAYALDFPLPFLAPVFAILLASAPSPPIQPTGLLKLLLVVIVTMGVGLVLVPALRVYPISAVLMIAAGLYAGTCVGRDCAAGKAPLCIVSESKAEPCGELCVEGNMVAND